ncbi:Hypothetical protein R9X50_00294300 [Acrodontium crateriforme]|uniref:Major facilitator superfamily (MFS) profile domain-containing protein n=1 Tax=Acrodontium crateriforme TaxID=150365 RepID=A0AAQ3R9H5_9PEZI|nr:Hypothetical protein R9X50_00294300 [Acrodontium crateriforme]
MDNVNPIPPVHDLQQPRQRHSYSGDEGDFQDNDSIADVPEDLFDVDPSNDEGLVDSPLLHLRPDQVDRLARQFVKQYGLENHEQVFIKAGKILRDPEAWQSVPRLTLDEKEVLKNEMKNTFWKQPKQLRVTIITLCVAAVVQGWNQTGTNGANLNWPQQFNIQLEGCQPTGRDAWVFAIVNASTYLSAALVGCWLSDPLNEYFFGRRAAILVSALLILASVIGGACTHSWEQLLATRVLLGIGMGCKASVVPVFAAEVAPAHIRGSLVMNWQIFDAFGIFLGFTANLIVANVGITAWRWQIASSALPTIVLLSLIYVCPESPRFLMKRGYYGAAYESLMLLRFHPILAAKELFYVHCQMEVETRLLLHHQRDSEARPARVRSRSVFEKGPLSKINRLRPAVLQRQETARPINYWQKLSQLFTVPRNRRALMAACVGMTVQQICGVNVLSFFSSTFFCNATSGLGNTSNSAYVQPLFLSWGIGLANVLFSLPAYYFIDSKGRRWLLLVTLPCMALSMLGAALAFMIPTGHPAHLPVIGVFTYIFMFFYSWGVGPVPFTLSAEVFPLESRVVGMSFAVFVNLFGAGLLALFVPALTPIIQHTGLLGIFAFFNVVSFVLVFFFVRETASAAVGGRFGSLVSVSLEELNYLFAVSTARHAAYQVKTVLPWAWKAYVKRDPQCSVQPEKLYTWASGLERETAGAEVEIDGVKAD